MQLLTLVIYLSNLKLDPKIRPTAALESLESSLISVVALALSAAAFATTSSWSSIDAAAPGLRAAMQSTGSLARAVAQLSSVGAAWDARLQRIKRIAEAIHRTQGE